MTTKNYWLFKSEPSSFSWQSLMNMGKQTSPWDGVRNYQARNFMRDNMKVGDQAFFYHSSCAKPGIVGIVDIVRESYPDMSALDIQDHHYDPKATADNPRWFMVDVKAKRELKRFISLTELKEKAGFLEGFPLLNRGNRLSVMPVSSEVWQFVLQLEKLNK